MMLPVSDLIGETVLCSRKRGPVTVISFRGGRSLYLLDQMPALSGGHRVWAEDSAFGRIPPRMDGGEFSGGRR